MKTQPMRSCLAATLLLLAVSSPSQAQGTVLEPAVYHVYGYFAEIPGATYYGLYPAYSSVWPTYGTYRGSFYWPLYTSGSYAAGYTPWVYGYYPWVFNSYPVAGAWYGPYVYSFRSYDWRGYLFPWGTPYFSPMSWSYPALRIGVTGNTTPVAIRANARRESVDVIPKPHLPPADALTLYGRARTAYRNHDYDDALTLIGKAIAKKSDDPRFWYIKAIVERALGKNRAAEESAQHAAAIEVLTRPDARQIGEALECIQGADRAWLRNIDRLSMSREQAKQIASAATPEQSTLTRASNHR